MNTVSQLMDSKIVAILRGFSEETVVAAAAALHKGGIRCIEVTFDQTAPAENTADMIRLLRRELGGEALVGAGTVLTLEQLQAAVDAGAAYIISPNADKRVIQATKAAGLVSMPGAYTPTEIAAAHSWGADIVKIFPLGPGGLEYFHAVRAPLSHIPLAAVGGVNLQNIDAYLEAGACCVGIGSNLASVKDAQAGNYDAITQQAAAYASRAGLSR